jgi:hypothetical protein
MDTKYYRIAVREKKRDNDFFLSDNSFSFTVLDFKTSDRFWMADPFLFEKDGVTYLFYEMFDFIKWKGVIAYSILHDVDKVSNPKIIIEEPYHLSFPFIYENDNEIFIMPETCANGDVHLYKAISFPDIWEKDVTIIQSVFVCDTIRIKDKYDTYFMASCMSKNPTFPFVISCYLNNVLYKLSECDEYFGCVNGVSVAKGDFGIRNAGAVFVHNGNIIRPGQDCRSGIYGAGLVFFSIKSFLPYKEELFKSIQACELQKS